MEKMRNLFLRSQCFNKGFLTKSKKKDTIFMGIIYTPFLMRNLHCKITVINLIDPLAM